MYRDSVRLSTEVFAAPDGTGSFLDHPQEGLRFYQVSAVDLAGNEGVLSDPSAIADAMPPPPPQNLTAVLNAFEQIELNWQAASTDTASYRLYRTTYSILAAAGAPFRNAAPPFVEAPASDAHYRYRVTALDLTGNESALSNEADLIYDKAAPRIVVLGVTSGQVSKTNLSPSFQAFDGNLAAGSPSATLNGAPFVSGSTITAEGGYSLVVTASDTEGHSSTTTVSFAIDKTAPSLAFAGITEGAVLFTTAAVNILVTDAHPGTSSFLLVNETLAESAPYQSGAAILRDGQYRLEASAADLAGNQANAVLRFRLDVAPVAPKNLAVRLEGPARIAWTKPEPDVVAYRVYRDGLRISGSLHAATAFEDGAGSGARVYEVSAVDGRGVEGPKARASVPAASLSLPATTLTRGYFDAIKPAITNAGASSFTAGPAVVELLAATATAPSVLVPAGGSASLEAVLAIPVNLASPASVKVAVSLPTDPGASVVLAQAFSVSAVDPAEPLVEVFPDALVPGTESPVRVRLYNRGTAPFDVVTAQIQNSTTAAVNDVQVRLKTSAGTLFASGGLKQTQNAATTIVNGTQVFFVTVPAKSSVLFEPVRVLVPSTALAALTVEAVVSTPTHSLPFARLAGTRGFRSLTAQAVVGQIAYRATAASERPVYDQGESILLTGRTHDEAGFAVPFATVSVHVVSNGFDRHVSTISDAAGLFAAPFFPMPSEAGIYGVYAAQPDVVTHAVQATFTITGFGFNFTDFKADMPQNASLPFTVELKNTGATPLEGLSASTSAISGSGVSLAVDPTTLPQTLQAGEAALIKLTLSSTLTAADSQAALTIRESHGFTRTLPIAAKVVAANPIPSATPQAFELGMLAGDTRTQTITLKNLGFDTWRGVRLSSPTLEWVKIQGLSDLGDIAPGKNVSFALSFEPPAGTPSQTYVQNPLLEVYSLNAATVPINAAIAVTSSKQGTLVFSIINADKPRSLSGQGVPVAGAQVRLTSLDINGLNFNVAGDLNGVAAFQNIPSGRYSWVVSSSGFQTKSGTVIVEPGLTKPIVAVLATAVVSYQWSVTPTTILDEYDVTLDLTFKTDVPAPVVILDPIAITMNVDSHVDAFGQFTVTNKGLVSAFNVRLKPRNPDGEVSITLPFEVIPELKAQQSVSVPYKISHGQVAGAEHCHSMTIESDYLYTCQFGIDQNGSCEPIRITIGTNCPGPSGISLAVGESGFASVSMPSVPGRWTIPRIPDAEEDGACCPPCRPHPKRTIGYREDSGHSHFPVGDPHLHLFRVNQDPKTCKCFWNKNNPDAVAPPPMPGWVNCNGGCPPLTP